MQDSKHDVILLLLQKYLKNFIINIIYMYFMFEMNVLHKVISPLLCTFHMSSARGKSAKKRFCELTIKPKIQSNCKFHLSRISKTKKFQRLHRGFRVWYILHASRKFPINNIVNLIFYSSAPVDGKELCIMQNVTWLPQLSKTGIRKSCRIYKVRRNLRIFRTKEATI